MSETVHEFARSYFDLWIAPLHRQMREAGPAELRRLRKEIARLIEDRKLQIAMRFPDAEVCEP